MKEKRKYGFIASLLDSLEYISSYALKFMEVVVVLLGLMFMSTYTDASGIAELVEEINGAEKVIVLNSIIILFCIEVFIILFNGRTAIGFKLICMVVLSVMIQMIPATKLLTFQAAEIVVGFRLIAGFFYRMYFAVSNNKSILVEKECRTVLEPVEKAVSKPLDESADDDNEEKESADATI